MASRSRLVNPPKSLSEINLTPLMDLTFILLITFIITFPLIEQGVAIQLPTGSTEDVDDPRQIAVTLDREGVLYLDGLQLPADQMQERLTLLGQLQPDTVVRVRADQALPYGRVMEIIRMLHQANLRRMALVTQAEGS